MSDSMIYQLCGAAAVVSTLLVLLFYLCMNRAPKNKK